VSAAVGTGTPASLDRAPWRWVWAALIVAVAGLYLARSSLPWAVVYPKEGVLPLMDVIDVAMRWLVENISWLTRGISSVMKVPLDFTIGLFAKGFSFGDGDSEFRIPRLSWLGIVAATACIGFAYGRWPLALLAGGCMLYIALFGQWESAMLTLASITICVPVGVASGLAVGIWGHRAPRVNRLVILPMLDLMQTVPAFAYLVPVLLLFGFGPVASLIATVIFAMPAMVRATTLALSQVPPEIDDFGDMVGCTRRQKLWRVQIPASRPLLMIGVNQVIMLTLNMVIIASMIGAGGLGYDVLLALRALKIGQGLESGMAIVVLAITLDRLSQAAASHNPVPHPPGTPFWRRHSHATLALAILAATTLLSIAVPALQEVPKSIMMTTAPIWAKLVGWINVNFFDAIEAIRVWLLLNILNPFKAFLLGAPWLGLAAAAAVAGMQAGGWRLGLLIGALAAFPALTGLWDKTMITIYLCAIGSVFAAMLGIPIGVLAARHDRFRRIVLPVIDTLQTLPSFVYLIPVVMLFRVGDVTALIAIVAFAIVPAIRYTNFGIRAVPPETIEAAIVAGCTPRQVLFRVQLPLAIPEIMLGINQTIMLALSMLVITALVGTRDLGQEVFTALAKAQPGRGIVAGLAVAFIGILADRLIQAWSLRARRRLNLA
jgi:glycine betaine/proline transport system permease protein